MKAIYFIPILFFAFVSEAQDRGFVKNLKEDCREINEYVADFDNYQEFMAFAQTVDLNPVKPDYDLLSASVYFAILEKKRKHKSEIAYIPEYACAAAALTEKYNVKDTPDNRMKYNRNAQYASRKYKSQNGLLRTVPSRVFMVNYKGGATFYSEGGDSETGLYYGVKSDLKNPDAVVKVVDAFNYADFGRYIVQSKLNGPYKSFFKSDKMNAVAVVFELKESNSISTRVPVAEMLLIVGGNRIPKKEELVLDYRSVFAED
jgi:hypothetical protein